MEKVFISVKDRANEEREPMKVAKERADQFLRNLNRNGKRTVNGKPQFYIVGDSEESQILPEVKKKGGVAVSVVNEVVTKTEFSPEKIRDYISKAQTLGALERIVAKVGEGYETEIEARKLEIMESNPLEQKEKPAPEAKAESKPKSESKPKEDKPKSAPKTNKK